MSENEFGKLFLLSKLAIKVSSQDEKDYILDNIVPRFVQTSYCCSYDPHYPHIVFDSDMRDVCGYAFVNPDMVVVDFNEVILILDGATEENEIDVANLM